MRRVIWLTFIVSGRKPSGRSVGRIQSILPAPFPLLREKCWTWTSLNTILSAQTIQSGSWGDQISAMARKTSVDLLALMQPLALNLM